MQVKNIFQELKR